MPSHFIGIFSLGPCILFLFFRCLTPPGNRRGSISFEVLGIYTHTYIYITDASWIRIPSDDMTKVGRWSHLQWYLHNQNLVPWQLLPGSTFRRCWQWWSPRRNNGHILCKPIFFRTVVFFWTRKWPSLGVVLLESEVLLFGNHSRPHFVFLRHVKGLRGLYLNQNYIGPEGCKCLGRPKILPGMGREISDIHYFGIGFYFSIHQICLRIAIDFPEPHWHPHTSDPRAIAAFMRKPEVSLEILELVTSQILK